MSDRLHGVSSALKGKGKPPLDWGLSNEDYRVLSRTESGPAQGLGSRGRRGKRRWRLLRGGSLSVADRGAPLAITQCIYTGCGDPDSERNVDDTPQHKQRSFGPVDWHPVDLRRPGLPADTGSWHEQRVVRHGQRVWLEAWL
jgi:hypothetical protein